MIHLIITAINIIITMNMMMMIMIIIIIIIIATKIISTGPQITAAF